MFVLIEWFIMVIPNEVTHIPFYIFCAALCSLVNQEEEMHVNLFRMLILNIVSSHQMPAFWQICKILEKKHTPILDPI